MKNIHACPVCSSGKQRVYLETIDHFLTQEPFTIVSCVDCGFKYTNPRPQDQDLSKYYQSEHYISHSNTKRGLVARLYHIVRNYTLKQKERLLTSYVARGTILDYGCGSGQFISYCKKKGWDVTGIEPDAGARAIAKQSVNSVYETREEFSLNQYHKEYDVITLWHVLEHLPDLDRVVDFLENSIKKGGVLLLALPNPNSFDAKKYGKYWAAYDLPRHLYHFEKSNLRALFLKSGLVLKETKPMCFDSFYVSILSEKYKSGKSRLIPAILTGLISNFKALRTGEYSSLIYVFQKAE